MNTAFLGLGVGIAFAIVLVYSVMVVNSYWTDPFVIISWRFPGALCGIVWMLFITGTTLSVPSLMGAIMAIGVATANSILLVNLPTTNAARTPRRARSAGALAAGHTRLRPVLMTALAKIIGMLPMSLGLGEGANRTPSVGRGHRGLLVATFVTLFFVPVVYSMLRHGTPELDRDAQFEREINEGEIQEVTS